MKKILILSLAAASFLNAEPLIIGIIFSLLVLSFLSLLFLF